MGEGNEGSHSSLQLWLLLRKNWLLKTRDWKSTCSEIIVPLMGVLILVMIRMVISISEREMNFHLESSSSLIQMTGRTPVSSFYSMRAISCGISNPMTDAIISSPITFAVAADDKYKTERDSLASAIRKSYQDLAKTLQATSIIKEIINCSNVPFICDFPINAGRPECDVPDTEVNITERVNREQFVQTFSSTTQMFSYVESTNYAINNEYPPIYIGISLVSVGPKWEYIFHLNQTNFPPQSPVDELYYSDPRFDSDRWSTYVDNRVIEMQYIVDNWILGQINPVMLTELDKLLIKFVPFPTAAFKVDEFASSIATMFSFFVLVPIGWPFSRLVKSVVEEKELRIKEGMKMMGSRAFAFWFSWGITYIVMWLLIALLNAWIAGGIFRESDFQIIFLMFFLFGLSLVTFGCMISAMFSRSKSAGQVCFFLLFGIWMFTSGISAFSPRTDQILACLLPPKAFALTADRILALEGNLIGVTSQNVNEQIGYSSVAECLWMLLLDFFLYGFLAWYFDNVAAGDFGTSQPFYFCVDPRYWCPNVVGSDISGNTRRKSSLIACDGDEKSDQIEEVSEELKQKDGITISNLRKVFGKGDKKHVAVNSLSLDLYEGQIFVLLGHNGAGKTTTINMLTGMMAPSSGTATMYGKSVNTELPEIRKILGVCPQHDILFANLTVEEHLVMFARLKGIPSAEVESCVKTAIEEISMKAKTKERSCNLSGGQKRRLSLAIALIGNSKVLFLDEPTSGVDPASRRAIWNLLSAKKVGRVIILTTHFMDEADILGDRIAILHKGKLKCVGSPLYLKNKFGVGYNITMMKKSTEVDSKDLISLVREHVPETSVLSDSGTEVAMRLPMASSKMFPAMLEDLESQGKEIGCTNFGLSVTTMEEVFLRVANEQEDPKEYLKTRDSITKLTNQPRMASGELNLLENVDEQSFLACLHLKALLFKRFHVCKRDKKSLCCQFLLPIILLAVGQIIFNSPTPANLANSKVQSMSASIYNDRNFPYNARYLNVMNDLNSTISHQNLDMYSFENTNGQLESINTTQQFSQRLFDERLVPGKDNMYGAGFYDRGHVNNTLDFCHFGDCSRYNLYVSKNVRYGMISYFNALTSGLFQKQEPSGDIMTGIQPFPKSANIKKVEDAQMGFLTAILVALSFTFIPAVYVVFIVKERELKSKHIQIVSGVNIVSYWLSNYIFDYLCYLVPGLISCLIINLLAPSAYTEGDAPSVVLAIMFMFGLAVIPFTYLCSFLFTSAASSQSVMISVYLFGGVFMTLGAFIMQIIPDTAPYAADFRQVFRLIPNFCLGDAFLAISLIPFTSIFSFETPKLMDKDIAGYDIYWLIAETFVYFGLTIILDSLILANKFSMSALSCATYTPGINEQGIDRKEDFDVESEKKKIQDDKEMKDLIILKGLRKVFPTKVAVNDLWFSIPAGQCFGFLGQNGAGKTTSLRMITGDEIPTSGDAFINGVSAIKEPWNVRKHIGYCPQFDALHPFMTAEETLAMYARIRGFPEAKISKMIGYLCDRLKLDQDNQHKRPAGTYSGGNKRKLSVAIALIGSPKCVFLDEPSTGMDPVSRRFMWDFISETMANRAVILTTHSMEECEALCSRISILVHGRLRCVGSSQHLKARFGKGFEFECSVNSDSIETARRWISDTFKGAVEIECYGGSMKYKLAKQDMTLSKLFGVVEENKERIGIINYSIGQTTLEQIFIGFAKDGEQEFTAMSKGEENYRSRLSLAIDNEAPTHEEKVIKKEETAIETAIETKEKEEEATSATNVEETQKEEEGGEETAIEMKEKEEEMTSATNVEETQKEATGGVTNVAVKPND